MLIANNISFERGSRIIFKDLNISLSSSKIIQITGKNGVGKTTLIKILSNILIPKSGDIYWNGKNIKKNNQFFLKNLTLIMDINTSKKDLTVNENIKFWKKLFSSKIKDIEIESLLFLLNLNIYHDTLVKYLSLGEIRKLELCRLIIEQKKLWIIDEPYLGLDETISKTLNETFKNHIKGNGMIIFSSHYRPQIHEIDYLKLENYANF